NRKREKQKARTRDKSIQDIDIHVDGRVRERHDGQIEGTTVEERVEKWGENWRGLDLGMETGEEISARGMACLEEIIANHQDENILIVSHGAFIKQILSTLFPDKDVEGSLDNCSVTVLKTTYRTWELTLHNCVKHI